MERTIKELAKEFSVSKQAIRARINKLPNTCYRIGDNNTILVNDEGYKILKERMSTRANNVDSQPDNNLTQLIDLLSEQLRQKDMQIAELQKALNQAQQLHMSDKLKLEDKKHWWNFRKRDTDE